MQRFRIAISAVGVILLTYSAMGQDSTNASLLDIIYMPGMTMEVMSADEGDALAFQAGVGVQYTSVEDLMLSLGINVGTYLTRPDDEQFSQAYMSFTLGGEYTLWRPIDKVSILARTRLSWLRTGSPMDDFLPLVAGFDIRWNIAGESMTTNGFPMYLYTTVGYGNDFTTGTNNEIICVGLSLARFVNVSLNVSSLWGGANPYVSYARFQ